MSVIDLPATIANADQALHAGLTLHAVQNLQRAYDESCCDLSGDCAETGYCSEVLTPANTWKWLTYGVMAVPSRLAQPSSAGFRRQLTLEWWQSGTAGVTLTIRGYLLPYVPDLAGHSDLDPTDALRDVDTYTSKASTLATPTLASGTITPEEVRAFDIGSGAARGPVSLMYLAFCGKVSSAGSLAVLVGPRLVEVP